MTTPKTDCYETLLAVIDLNHRLERNGYDWQTMMESMPLDSCITDYIKQANDLLDWE